MFGGGNKVVLDEKRRSKLVSLVEEDRTNNMPINFLADASAIFFGRRSAADQIRIDIHEDIDVQDPIGLYQRLSENYYYGLAPLVEPDLASYFLGRGRYVLMHAYGDIINAFNTLESLTFNRLTHQRAYLENIWWASCYTRNYFWPNASILLKIMTLKRDFFEFIPAIHPKTKRDTLEIVPLFLTYLKPDGVYRIPLARARSAILQVMLADLLAVDLKVTRMRQGDNVLDMPIIMNPRLEYELSLKPLHLYPEIPEFGSNGNPAGKVIANMICDFYLRGREEYLNEKVHPPEKFKELVSMTINYDSEHHPTFIPEFRATEVVISHEENIALNQLSVSEVTDIKKFLEARRKKEKEKMKKRRQRDRKKKMSGDQGEPPTATISLTKRAPSIQTQNSVSRKSSTETIDKVA